MIKYDDTTNETAEYAAFIEKFKPKKTTDDCYTPANIYEAVKDWAVAEYNLQGRELVRPFYPGGDDERHHYPEGCVVLDNPPFSILSKICRFYEEHGVDYFLFAPSLTLFSTNSGRSNYIVTGADIIYDNGANVKTSFITNMGDYRITLAPDLAASMKAANDENTKTADLPKYEYPDHVVTAAILQKIVQRGVSLRVPHTEASFIRALDHQREHKKAIFGGGFLLSDRMAEARAAADKAAAEQAAADALERSLVNGHKWQLSEREREIIRGMDDRELMGG